MVVGVDRPETGPLVIPVSGEVRGPFSVSPSTLYLGAVAGRSEIETNLIVTGESGKLEVQEMSISPESWNVRYGTIGSSDGRVLRLRLKILVPNSKGVLDATLRLLVAGGGEKPVDLNVPMVASVHPPAAAQTIAGP
ncbi:MAG: hypothetical protein ACP5XB_19450 [Isosphaeraceae bacterium]